MLSKIFAEMEHLDVLKKVRRVEAPPFLLTRIKAKIRANEAESLPVSWVWSGAMACGLLVLANVVVLKAQGSEAMPLAEKIDETLQIQLSNQLYNE